MKKLLKKLGALLLCLVFVFSLAACGDRTPTKDDPDDPTVDPPPTQTDPVPPELSELIDDEYATAERGDKPEVPRFPEDEEWKQLLEKQQAIEAGEKFTETFDGTYFTSRLSAVSDGASFKIIDINDDSDAIEGKSLRITTEGNYAGIRLTGAKFIAGATYTVKMDYNVITPSDDFFFQFRDATAGSVSDLFTTFGATAGKGSIEHTFTLGMYSGYYIMIMPRTKAGELVIDNIEITRDDSRPMASEVSLKGEVAVGSTVEASYVYSDYENDPEGESEIRWFTALTDTGMNKMMLDNTGKTLEITEDMNGKYIGFQVIPKASQGENSTGVPVLFMATETVGGGRPDYGEKFSLEPGESFTETFEADTGEDKNLIYVPHGNTDNYIYKDADRNSNVLRIKSDGAYYGTDFTGMTFEARGLYRISFDYKFLVAPNTFYVQLRTSAMEDSFYQLPTNEPNTWKRASQVLEVGTADGAYLMMFPDSTAVEILIDNLKIERISPDDPEIMNDPFFIREKSVNETFESVLSRQLYPEAKGGATFEITNATGKCIDGNSVYISTEDAGEVILNGAKAEAGQSYTIQLSYSVLKGNDVQIGFMAADGTAGDFVSVEDTSAGIKSTILRVSAPNDDKEYFLTIRAGASSELIIDNVKAEWIDVVSSGSYESFESGSAVYERRVIGNTEAEVQLISSGNVLKVTAPANGGVAFKHKSAIENGSVYAVTFTFSMTSAADGNKLVVKLGEGGTTTEIDATQGTSGRKTVYLTAAEADAEVFITASTACEFTLDDIYIQADTRKAGYMGEGSGSSAPFTDESGEYRIDVNNSSSVSFTNEARYQSDLSSGSVLLVESKGAYGGVQIRNDAWGYDAAATYKITLTYTIIANPNGGEMYIQLGATSVNKMFNGDDTAVGATKTVEFELTANAAWDCVMIFGGGGANGFIFTIDDFCMTVVS